MATIPYTAHPVDLDAALRGLATQARTRYAGEAARIDRGLVIALKGGVMLHADGTATVRYRGAQWTVVARDGSTLATGEHKVTEVIGSRLVVEKI